ncbi:MAG: hypothetical protein NC313_11015 [Butyrivibrio sp.]|nr:hypothetical protein [Butyrivibrio sp.]
MNIGKFKEIVSTWENSEENFKLFRVWAENCYYSYKKNYDFEKTQARVIGVGPKNMRKLEHSWESIYYDDAIMTYCEMGWELDEKIKKIENSYDESGFLYCDVAFSDIYEKIQTVEDDVEFSYAVLSVTKGVDTNCDLYTEFVKKLHRGLKEYTLFSAIDIIGREQKKKVFIAMSFDNSMEKARKAISDAIKSCGYDPMLIDNKEHNNQIVPEIYKEISDSKFVIADLTGQRGGVYYEAGYAVAKDKNLILSCKEGENPHFDVAQINTIFWKDEQDLKERLIKRIEATIWKNE